MPDRGRAAENANPVSLARKTSCAGMLALPRSIGMAFTNPPVVLAKGAFHSQNVAELVFGER